MSFENRLKSSNEDNVLLRGDSTKLLKGFSKNSVDMVLTSPPYDNLRTYNNQKPFLFNDFKIIANELYRILKPGGVIVWIVGDAVINGSETGTSFRQAIYFKELGLKLHDTMIYEKTGFSFPMSTRYHQIFEYMFVLSKGKPKTFNPIKDRKNKEAGRKLTCTERQRDGTLKKSYAKKNEKRLKEFGMRNNIWRIHNGLSSIKDKTALDHPATFPEQLAYDHIISWSNPFDVVIDPFMGSGTTGKTCKSLNRKFIGIEIDKAYFNLAKSRIN